MRRALRDRQPAFADDTLGADALRVYAAPLGELGRGRGGRRRGDRGRHDRRTSSARWTARARSSRCARWPPRALAAGAGDAAHPPRAAAADAGCRPARARSSAPATRPSACRSRPRATRSAELAGTLNAMLASLERAREAEHRFVGDASHELRTPLTALRGNAAYIARHGADPAVLADIEAGAERLSRAARRPAGAGARGRRGAGAGRAGRARPSWPARRRRGGRRARGDVRRSSGPRSSARSSNLVRNARKHGTGRVTITVGGDDGEAFIRVAGRRPGPAPRPSTSSSASARRRRAAARAPGLGLAIVQGDRRAPRRPRRRSTARRSRCLSKNSQGPPVQLLHDEKTPHRILPRLLAIVAVLVAVVAGAGIAQAALTGAPKPAPKALDQAVLDAVNAPAVEGVTARIEFTNNLLPVRLAARATPPPPR